MPDAPVLETASATADSPPCLSCGNASVRRVEFPLPDVYGLKYRVADRNAARYECRGCGSIFRREHGPVEQYYAVPEDAGTPDSVVQVYAPESGEYVTNHFLMTKILARLIEKPEPRLIDIGCGTGDFLKEVRAQHSEYRLYGFDVPAVLKERVESIEQAHYFSGVLSDVPGTFDVATLIDSLSFIEDMQGLFAFLDERLAAGGLVFVTTPNIARNPMTLLIGLQHFYFTADNLGSLFAQFGYGFEPIDVEHIFPRHVFGIARRGGKVGRRAAQRSAPDLNGAARYMCSLARNLARLAGWWDRSARPGERLGVLGTKHNAAIAASLLGSRIGFIADETPGMTGRWFHGHKVVRPDQLTDRDLVLVPYGPSARSIQRRCQQVYRARFLAL